jgi:hypothetical protein
LLQPQTGDIKEGKTLEEEKLTDEKLTQLAMSGINLDAAEADEPQQPVATKKKRPSS